MKLICSRLSDYGWGLLGCNGPDWRKNHGQDGFNLFKIQTRPQKSAYPFKLQVQIRLLAADVHAGKWVDVNFFFWDEFELLKNLNNTPITNCELEAWNFLNLSLSGWNMILTLLMIIGWFYLIKSKGFNYETNSASQ